MINVIKSIFSKYDFYVGICTIIKDENQYLKEWLDYHTIIGISHFYLYDNGSKTPISQTVDELGYADQVTVIDFPGESMQNAAYQHCLKRFGHQCRWIGFIDIDEFIVPKKDNYNLATFLTRFENYGGLGINWYVFGSGGHKEKSNQHQTERFTLRAKWDFSVNRHIKSIVQPRFIKRARDPHSFKYVLGKYCVNEKFEKIEGSLADHTVNDIHINHYFCRSLEEYKEKLSRGRADGSDEGRNLERFYHFDKSANDVEDRTILEVMAKLKAQANG